MEFLKEYFVYYYKFFYGVKILEVSVSVENVDVNVIQVNEFNGMCVSIYIQFKDGGQL